MRERKGMKLKNNSSTTEKISVSGITLVALVITIIILLILAGVTLEFVFSETGIIELADKARKNYINAEQEESRKLENLYSSILIATNDESQITVTMEDLKNIIKEQIKEEMKEENKNPTGTVISYMGNNAPEGYLPCDGGIYNISDEKYMNLAEQIKNEFGKYNYFGGDGETTFAVPDLRGEFLRGTGTNSHAYGGRGLSVGTHQEPTLIPCIESNINGQVINSHNSNGAISISNEDWVRLGRVNVTTPQDSTGQWNGRIQYTMRPTNTSVLYCIKY
ncbi:MAG: hypothetical protein HFJ27_05085 [Clostridia bacterium]|nr:hypothetical protein [Clostridia bacterium]